MPPTCRRPDARACDCNLELQLLTAHLLKKLRPFVFRGVNLQEACARSGAHSANARRSSRACQRKHTWYTAKTLVSTEAAPAGVRTQNTRPLGPADSRPRLAPTGGLHWYIEAQARILCSMWVYSGRLLPRVDRARSRSWPTTTRTSEAPSSIPSTLGLTLVFEPGISEYAWACLGTALGRAERNWDDRKLLPQSASACFSARCKLRHCR